ncbi:hypothetical protein N2152v2_009864 [Parachlorella kessleri]
MLARITALPLEVLSVIVEPLETVDSLAFDFQLQQGDWPALAAALQPLTRLTRLRLTDSSDRASRCSAGGTEINFKGVALRSLRRLEVATSHYVLVQADLSLCDSLESVYISPHCRVGHVHAPPSFARLSFPLEVGRNSVTDWDCVAGASAPGLRELQLFCS